MQTRPVRIRTRTSQIIERVTCAADCIVPGMDEHIQSHEVPEGDDSLASGFDDIRNAKAEKQARSVKQDRPGSKKSIAVTDPSTPIEFGTSQADILLKERMFQFNLAPLLERLDLLERRMTSMEEPQRHPDEPLETAEPRLGLLPKLAPIHIVDLSLHSELILSTPVLAGLVRYNDADKTTAIVELADDIHGAVFPVKDRLTHTCGLLLGGVRDTVWIQYYMLSSLLPNQISFYVPARYGNNEDVISGLDTSATAVVVMASKPTENVDTNYGAYGLFVRLMAMGHPSIHVILSEWNPSFYSNIRGSTPNVFDMSLSDESERDRHCEAHRILQLLLTLHASALHERNGTTPAMQKNQWGTCREFIDSRLIPHKAMITESYESRIDIATREEWASQLLEMVATGTIITDLGVAMVYGFVDIFLSTVVTAFGGTREKGRILDSYPRMWKQMLGQGIVSHRRYYTTIAHSAPTPIDKRMRVMLSWFYEDGH